MRRARQKHRAIATAVALSLIVHVAVFWKWMPQVRFSSSEEGKRGTPPDELIVRIEPRQRTVPTPPSKPSPAVKPLPKPRGGSATSRAAKPPPPPRPPVLALKEPAPRAEPTAPRAPAPAPPVPVAPPVGDLATYVEARRKARGETTPAEPSRDAATADANARATKLAAANIAAGRDLTFGYDPRRSGGVFSTPRLSDDYAEFVFYGWQKEIKRNTQQPISVRRGNASNIRVAVVRKMIAIIREYEQGDFVWESRRLGYDVTLSARARDNAGLEEFMMKEFFDDFPRPQ